LIGGATVGAVDVAGAALTIGGIESAAMAALGLGLGGAAGLIVALLHDVVFLVLSRVIPRRAAGLAWAAVVLAAPLAFFDAFALFGGRRASALPGRHAVSAVLAVVGLLALFFFARWLAELIDRIEEGRARQRYGWLMAAALLVVAAAAHGANWVVLPRLYPWFHATLGVAVGVATIVSTRLALAALGIGKPPLGRRGSWGLLAFSIVVGTALIWGWRDVRSSGNALYLAHERTLIAGPLLAVLTGPPQSQAATARRIAPAPSTSTPAEFLPAGPRRPGADVVLISVDALRADHVGAYGYRRGTTPNIDALAARSVRFERVYTQAPHTSFSVASLLTGTYFGSLARLGFETGVEPISALLRGRGWATAAFYPPAVFFVDGDKLQRFAAKHFDFEYVKFDYLGARTRLDQVVEFFEQQRPRRAFTWVHFFEPHEPYESCPGRDLGPRDVDRYDSEIACVDEAVGRLLAYLDSKRPGAIVILTSDHGEEFDEHGGRYHGSTLYDEQIRVPLLVRFPGVTPHVVGGQVQLVDVVPTILGLLDLEPPAWVRGTDLGPWLAAPAAPAAVLPPAFAEFEYKRMAMRGMEKLICDMNWGVCAFHDLRTDPREQTNLVDRWPQRVAVLRAHLDGWLDGHARFRPAGQPGPGNADGGAVPRAIERARLGDLSVVTELAAMLRSDQPLSVRREAARLLVVKLPRRPETRELVFAALSADDPEIRDWAALAAARLGHARGAARTRAIVRDEGQERELRLQAALSLAVVDDAAGVPFLIGTLGSCGSVELCRLVILALGKLRDRRATGPLVGQIAQIQNRRETVYALGNIGDPAAVDAIGERLSRDEFVPVRIEAAAALAKIGGQRARDSLAQASTREREPVVLEAVRRAVEAIDAKGPPRQPSPPAVTGSRSTAAPRRPGWPERAPPGGGGRAKRPRTAPARRRRPCPGPGRGPRWARRLPAAPAPGPCSGARGGRG
jgi:arylsulfatase A-like enzyme